MNTPTLTKTVLASLQATAAAGVLATSLGVVSASAAVDGFEVVAPQDIANTCTHETTFKKTCQEN